MIDCCLLIVQWQVLHACSGREESSINTIDRLGTDKVDLDIGTATRKFRIVNGKQKFCLSAPGCLTYK